MAVVTILDGVTAWVREVICSQIRLKVPPADEQAATDAGYEYQLVTPAAFSLFVPTKEKLPPSVVSPIPSVCVRILEGADNLAASSGSIGVQLCFFHMEPRHPRSRCAETCARGQSADAAVDRSGGRGIL